MVTAITLMQFATCNKYIRASREVYALWEKKSVRACVFGDRGQSPALPNPLPDSLIRGGGTTTAPLRSRVELRVGGKYTLRLQYTSPASITYLW